MTTNVYTKFENNPSRGFLSYRVNTIAGDGRLRSKTITSPDPSDTGDIISIRLHQLNNNIYKGMFGQQCKIKSI